MPAGRDTGLQVIHYLGAVLTAQTPMVGQGVKLGEMPLGSIITDADVAVTGAFGAGALLQFHRTLGGPVFCAIPVLAVGRKKLSDASNILSAAEAGVGGPIWVSITGGLPVTGALSLLLSYAPKIG